MSESIALLFAQINPTVGAVEANAALIAEIIKRYQSHHDCIVFPELSLSGYPPEDLLFNPGFHQKIEIAIQELAQIVNECYVIIPHPAMEKGKCYNRATVFYRQELYCYYDKQALPNYGVFDEVRYFSAGSTQPCVLSIKNQRIGLCICEDLWQGESVERLLTLDIDHLLCINASPFEQGKFERRIALAERYIAREVNVLYLNLFGGQDELVFDGRSFVLDRTGSRVVELPAFQEDHATLTLWRDRVEGPCVQPVESVQILYQALVMAIADYVNKNGFPGVLLGLSGGIDSSLVAAIAVKALGRENVVGLSMPSMFSSDGSKLDAKELAENLGIMFKTIEINQIFEIFANSLSDEFAGTDWDATEENIQSRIRGNLVMAMSNKFNWLVLTTGNKSEMAVGYATIYGDMAGGFSVIKDVPKTTVYDLCEHINRSEPAPVIPYNVIDKPPSAELRPDQKDSDSLPDYSTLDSILRLYIEDDMSMENIVNRGFEKSTVSEVIKLVDRNEYKRRQSAPGVKITSKNFGRDRRMPISNKFKSY